MKTHFRANATYANVTSTICLFILLGGGAAYAASNLPKDSVGARQIKQGAVRTAEVRDSSLLASDFKQGQLPAGPPGADGTARAYGFISSTGVVDPTQSKGIAASKITGQLGAYCVRPDPSTGIDPAHVRPVVSADLAQGTGSTHVVQISSNSFYPAQCPSAAGWEIYTQGQSAPGAFVNADVAFSIMVP